MKLKRLLIPVIVIGCVQLFPCMAAAQQTQEEQIQAYIDMMRKNIRNERNTIIDQAMELEPAGKAKFWAVFDGYSKEGKTLWDERLANIKKYADNQEQMTDAIADELAVKALEIQEKRVQLLKKYYGRMKSELGARVAARFLQVEAMLDNVLDLQLGSEIPLMR